MSGDVALRLLQVHIYFSINSVTYEEGADKAMVRSSPSKMR